MSCYAGSARRRAEATTCAWLPRSALLLTVLPGHLISLLESVGETPQDNLPEALRRLLPLAYPTDPDAERA